MTSTYQLSPRRASDPERSLEDVKKLLPSGAQILVISDNLVQYTLGTARNDFDDLESFSSDEAEEQCAELRVDDTERVKVPAVKSKSILKPSGMSKSSEPPKQVRIASSVDDDRASKAKNTFKPIGVPQKQAAFTPPPVKTQQPGDYTYFPGKAAEFTVPNFAATKKRIGTIINAILLETIGMRLYSSMKDSTQYHEHFAKRKELTVKLVKALKKNCGPECVFPQCITGATQGDFCSYHHRRIQDMTENALLRDVAKSPFNKDKVLNNIFPLVRKHLDTPDGIIDGFSSRDNMMYFVGFAYEWHHAVTRALKLQKRYPEFQVKLILYRSGSSEKRLLILNYVPKSFQVTFLH